MRVWCLHVTDCAFAAEQPRGDVDATALADAAVEDPDDTAATSEGAIEEGVVALVGVEQRDATAVQRGTTTPAGLATRALDVIGEAADDLGESSLVVLPAPAIASSPAAGAFPSTVLERLDEALAQRERASLRAPAGWHLSVDSSVRGHPVASRVHDLSGARHGAASIWGVVDADGSTTDVAEADLPIPEHRYLDHRRGPHTAGDVDLTAARETGFVADADERMVLTPTGTLVCELLGEHLEALLRADGARPVGALATTDAPAGPPLLPVDSLDPDNLSVSAYTIEADADHDAPVAGAVVAVTTAVDGVEAGLEALEAHVVLLREWLADAGLSFVAVLSGLDDGARRRSLVEAIGRPVLFERSDDASPGVELAVTDETGQPVATAQFRLRQGGDASPATVHTTVGTLEGFTVALCRQAGASGRRFPAWLAPTQVRLLPLSPTTHRPRCEDLAELLASQDVRADIDDRQIPVSERLEAASTAGVPYVATVGEDELDGETVPVTDRGARTERVWSAERLAMAIAGDTEGFPDRDLAAVRRLDDRLFVDE